MSGHPGPAVPRSPCSHDHAPSTAGNPCFEAALRDVPGTVDLHFLDPKVVADLLVAPCRDRAWAASGSRRASASRQ
jgi:hypothetical protein